MGLNPKLIDLTEHSSLHFAAKELAMQQKTLCLLVILILLLSTASVSRAVEKFDDDSTNPTATTKVLQPAGQLSTMLAPLTGGVFPDTLFDGLLNPAKLKDADGFCKIARAGPQDRTDRCREIRCLQIARRCWQRHRWSMIRYCSGQAG